MAKSIQEIIADNRLSIKAVFVPFSQSRNKDENHQSINWKVKLVKTNPFTNHDFTILNTDYSQGIAHLPLYDKKWKNTATRDNYASYAAESGRGIEVKIDLCGKFYSGKPIPPPKIEDVLYCLISDCDVLDYASFEEWADNCGFDADSRKAESIYQDCLKLALALRSALGEAAISAFREAFQDY